MPGEKEIDAKKLFGEDSVLHVQKPAGISTENLEDYYKRSFQEEEQRRIIRNEEMKEQGKNFLAFSIVIGAFFVIFVIFKGLF